MEQLIKITIIGLIGLIYSTVHTQEVGLLLSRMEVRPGRFNQTEIAYVSDTKNYIKGGVTFTYPKGIFKVAPAVNISIELANHVYTEDEIIAATIIFNNECSTIIRVNGWPSGIEICTDDVIVHLHAIGR